MTEPVIYFAETGDRVSFVKHVMDKFRVDFTQPENLRVFVKPNIVSHEPYPTTTHPDVLAAVLDFLLECGCRVEVGDGPAFDAGDAGKIISNHPLSEVCEKRGIRLQDLHKCGFRKFKTPTMSMWISEPPLDCDRVISLPVLKPHLITRMTGALKNQFGLLRNQDRILMHTGIKNLSRGIAEINTVIKPALFIVDGVETYTRANECRHGGCRQGLGYMLAGNDPVAIDCLGLDLLKKTEPGLKDISPSEVGYIAHAVALGLGSIKWQTQTV